MILNNIWYKYMNYNKIKVLVHDTKGSEEGFYNFIRMSEVGFRKMMKMKTAKVETLELIAKYFNKSVCYFFDEPEVKSYPENNTLNIIEDTGNITLICAEKERLIAEKNKLIASNEKLIAAKDAIIKLLTDKLGIDIQPDGETAAKTTKKDIKGFRGVKDEQFRMVLNEIIKDLNRPH